MSLLSGLMAASFAAYLGLAVFVTAKSPGSVQNRLIAAILLGFAVWSLQDVLRFNPEIPQDVVRMAVNVGALGWCSIPSIGLWFAIVFTRKQEAHPRPIAWVPLLLVSALFVYKQWTNGLVVELIRLPLGWAGVWSRSLWTDLYDVYQLAATGVSLYLVLRFAATTDSAIVRRQSLVFVSTGASSLLVGFVVNRLLPRMGSYGVPQFASLAGLIWGSGLAHAITRHRMLAITPATAAENIIATMTDLLLLVNAQGRIVTVNPSTLDALGYLNVDLVDHPIDMLFSGDAGIGVWQEIVACEDRAHQWSLSLVRKTGEQLPVLLSASRLRHETGHTAGIVIVAKDVADRVRAEDAEREKRILAEVSRDTVSALSSTLDSQEVMERILVSVGRIVAHDTADIMLVEAGVAHVARNAGYAGYGSDAWIDDLRLVVEEVPTLRRMMETRLPLVVSDTHDYPGWQALSGTEWMRSYVGVPVLLEGQVIGFLNLGSETPAKFQEADAEKLRSFADQIAIAIRNSRLYERARHYAVELEEIIAERTAELRTSEARLAALNNVFLSFGPDALENIGLLTRLCGEMMGATCALYNRLDEGMLCSWGQWNAPPGYSPKDSPEGHICYDVIRRGTGDPLVIRNLLETRYACTDPNVKAFGLRTYVGQPVRFDDDIVGSLCAVYQHDADPSVVDIRFMSIIASAIGVEEKRRKAEERLRASEERYQMLFESAPDAYYLSDLKGMFVDGNHAAELLVGFRRGELVGRNFLKLKLLPVSQIPRAAALLAQNALGLPTGPDGFTLRRKNGSHVEVEIRTHPVRLDDQALVLGIARDVTQRKQAEEELRRHRDRLEEQVLERTTELRSANRELTASLQEKEVLLQEVHHRVKNNLQVVASLLNLQSRYLDDPRAIEVFRESQGRIHSMALIHEQLYRSENLAQVDFGRYARELATHLLRSYDAPARGICLTTDVRDAFLDIATAVPCGLILNELVSNALKHAFPDGRTGEIRIGLREADEQYVILTVSDDGVGFPEDLDLGQTDSLGLKLVTILAEQLGGTIALECSAGTAFTLRFPAPPLHAR